MGRETNNLRVNKLTKRLDSFGRLTALIYGGGDELGLRAGVIAPMTGRSLGAPGMSWTLAVFVPPGCEWEGTRGRPVLPRLLGLAAAVGPMCRAAGGYRLPGTLHAGNLANVLAALPQ